MHTDDHHPVHHKNRHFAQRIEGMLGILMVVAIAALAVWLVYGMVTGDGNATPSYLR